MAKSTAIIDASDLSITYNAVAIENMKSVAFSVRGSKEEINLSTIGDTQYVTKLYSILEELENVTITKLSEPAVDEAIATGNNALVITYSIGRTTAKTLSYYAEFLGTSNATAEIAPSDGVTWDLEFGITNLDASLAETGPAIAAVP